MRVRSGSRLGWRIDQRSILSAEDGVRNQSALARRTLVM